MGKVYIYRPNEVEPQLVRLRLLVGGCNKQ